MRRLIVLITALVFINFGLFVYAPVNKAETENQQEGIVVQDSMGRYVGTITNLVEDSSGNIAFLILSMSEQGELSNREIAIPVGILSYDDENRMIVLDLSKEELAGAPGFDVSDLGNPAFAGKVYRFFGLMPAWKE